MKNKYVFTAVLLCAISLIGCFIANSVNKREDVQENSLHIVTSFYPMYIAVENIVEDIEAVTVENLTDPKTGCLHDYQLQPEDMIALSKADLFIVNGGGIEPFLDDIREIYPELPVIEASEGIAYLECEAEHDHDHEHGHDHDHGAYNAHVWMDMDKYIQEIINISEGIQRYDAAHTEVYQHNQEHYISKLTELKEEWAQMKEDLTGQHVLIFHDAFAYLADACGMEIAQIIEMDENTTFSAKQIYELVELIKSEGIDILLVEEQYGTKIADAISRETKAKVYVLNSLVSGEDDPDSYINGMKENMEQLRTAFLEAGKE